MEQIIDLLVQENQVKIRNDPHLGVVLEGLAEYDVTNKSEVL